MSLNVTHKRAENRS